MLKWIERMFGLNKKDQVDNTGDDIKNDNISKIGETIRSPIQYNKSKHKTHNVGVCGCNDSSRNQSYSSDNTLSNAIIAASVVNSFDSSPSIDCGSSFSSSCDCSSSFSSDCGSSGCDCGGF